ncbi:hypothetical protein ACTFIR_007791 [Dictyostelium discoideum]
MNNMQYNEILFFKVFRNKYIFQNIFYQIKLNNKQLKYYRFNYYDVPLETIIKTKNKILLLEKLNNHEKQQLQQQQQDQQQQNQQHQQQQHLLIFEKSWFNELFKLNKEWFDLELFLKVYNLFKIDVVNILLKSKSYYSRLLIIKDNLNVLMEIGHLIFNFGLSGIERLVDEKKLLSIEMFNYLDSFGFIDSKFVFNQLYILFGKYTMDYQGEGEQDDDHDDDDDYNEYYYKRIDNNGVTSEEEEEEEGEEIINEIVRYNSNDHFEYIKLLYNNNKLRGVNNQTSSPLLKNIILQIALKYDDSDIFKLLYSNYHHCSSSSSSSSSSTNKTNPQQFIKLCDGIMVKLEEFLHEGELFRFDFGNYKILDLFAGRFKSIDCARYRIIMASLLVSLSTQKRNISHYVKTIDDPDLADFIIDNKLQNDFIFSHHSLRNDLSNASKFITNNIKLWIISKINSPVKVRFLLNNGNIAYGDKTYLYCNETVNNNQDLIEAHKGLFSIFSVKFLIEIQISKRGFNNILDSIMDRPSYMITNSNSNSAADKLMKLLFFSIKENLNHLYKKLFKILLEKNSTNKDFYNNFIHIFYILVSLNRIPLSNNNNNNNNNNRREIYLNRVYKVLTLNGNNLKLIEFYKFSDNIKRFEKMTVLKKKKRHLSIRNYLTNLDLNEFSSVFINDSSSEKSSLIKYLIQTNNYCLLNEFSKILNNNDQDKLFYLKYSVWSNYPKSFTYLMEIIKFDNWKDGFFKILKFIILKDNIQFLNSILFNYNFNNINNNNNNNKNNNYNSGDGDGDGSIIDKNYFLNYCHIIILYYSCRFNKIGIIEKLVNEFKYNYSPINYKGVQLIIQNQFTNELIQKFKNNSIIISFIKNVGLEDSFSKNDIDIVDFSVLKLTF